jgi:hypothetical protein
LLFIFIALFRVLLLADAIQKTVGAQQQLTAADGPTGVEDARLAKVVLRQEFELGLGGQDKRPAATRDVKQLPVRQRERPAPTWLAR